MARAWLTHLRESAIFKLEGLDDEQLRWQPAATANSLGAIVVHLVEISPALQQIQERRLADLDVPVLWHTALDEVPAGASIVIANEFVDALPVHQAVKQDDGWHERAVGIGPDGDAFGLVVTLVIHVPGMERDKVREFAEAAHQVCPYSRATRGNISVELRVL